MKTIAVIKRSPQGEERWRYTATVLKNDGDRVHLEAPFNAPDVPFMGDVIRHGDRFVETYFTDRWYNIFEIHDRDSDRLKGWYCNIGRPAVWEDDETLSYMDLALDLWVAPDGRQTVLDEDEFAALDLDEETRVKARAALHELQNLFKEKITPGM